MAKRKQTWERAARKRKALRQLKAEARREELGAEAEKPKAAAKSAKTAKTAKTAAE